MIRACVSSKLRSRNWRSSSRTDRVPRIPFAGNLLIVRSDSGDDFDPSLMHRLEPLSLLLRILVWDGADDVVAPAVLVDLARVPPDATWCLRRRRCFDVAGDGSDMTRRKVPNDWREVGLGDNG